MAADPESSANANDDADCRTGTLGLLTSLCLLISGERQRCQQHELASSAEGFTLVRDQSVIAILVGKLRGRWRNHSGLRNSGTIACTVHPSMLMHWISESMLFSSSLSVVPSTEDSGTLVSLTALMTHVIFLIQRLSS